MRLAVAYWPTPRNCCQTFPIRRKSLKRRALWPTSKFCPVERSETGATIWLCIARQLRLRNRARRISRQRPNLFKLTSSLTAWAILFRVAAPMLFAILFFMAKWKSEDFQSRRLLKLDACRFLALHCLDVSNCRDASFLSTHKHVLHHPTFCSAKHTEIAEILALFIVW